MEQLGIIRRIKTMSDNINNYAVTDTAPPSKPLTREEQYLSAIAGVTPSTEIPPVPITRAEKYLNKIVENGGGGGGTSDYTDLSNKPQINGQTLVGNKASSELGLQFFISDEAKLNANYTYLKAYVKAQTVQAITESDSAVQALGKLDYRIDLCENKIFNQETSIQQGGRGYALINGIRLYVSSTAPTGNIPDGSVGVGW